MVSSLDLRLPLAVRYAKASGLKVVAIDIDDKTLANAKQAGVEYTFNSRTDPNFIEELKKVTSGGADAVAVFTAVKAGYDVAPKTLKLGGKLVCVGCPPNDISLNALSIALGMYTVVGASNHAPPAQLREMADFTVEHAIECPMQFFKIDQIEEMIDLMQSGKMGGNRLVVQF
jgi:D-arabinose 1-dehydrogenase-like Zn-dependent alcohol dehydrogenase